jgi:uncharacterized metal-binding protein
MELVPFLKSLQIDTLICGGVSRETRELLHANSVDVVDNVACSASEIVAALEAGTLRSGYGFDSGPESGSCSGETVAGTGTEPSSAADLPAINCVRCEDRKCLRGHNCFPQLIDTGRELGPEVHRVLEAATDVSQEDERKLCRLSELVYFCLEMGYRRVGIAFCIELLEPAEILARVLGRFFGVFPVCCKVGGTLPVGDSAVVPDSTKPPAAGSMACNPTGQAAILNRLETDFNVIVGLCVGADCIFSRESDAPVTTLFVKDKSLANNPIGAVYSEYYLRESLAPEPGRVAVPFLRREDPADGPERGKLS